MDFKGAAELIIPERELAAQVLVLVRRGRDSDDPARRLVKPAD